MKVKVDEKEILELEDWHKAVIKNDIPEEIFEEDMKRRVHYILTHKFERCFERFQNEWLKKLRDDPSVTSIPTDKKALVEMVMARPDYKSRSKREADAGQAPKNPRPPLPPQPV
jgi:hypothetical protein